MKTSFLLLTCVSMAAALAMGGCGKADSPTTPSTAPASAAPADAKPASLTATLKSAQATAAAAKANAPKDDGNTYREQGTMAVDAGQGVQQLQSMATVIDPKLGEKTAARLASAEGQQKLAQATAGAPQVTGAGIQATVDQVAGRTMYSSQAVRLEIIKAYGVELDARSPGEQGVRVQLLLTMSDKDLALQQAEVQYYPDKTNLMESYKKKIPIADVKLDKVERKNDQTLSLSGHFKAADLSPGGLSKSLKGKSLATLSGRFDFAEVHIR